jgi:hypothetical protein
MKKGMWVGGLVLWLAGWAPDLSAQQVVWRPAVRPAAATQPVGTPTRPAASLGRPVALSPDASVEATQADPRPTPGLVQTSFRAPAVLARAQNPEVVANSMTPQAGPQEQGEPDAPAYPTGQVVPAVWRGWRDGGGGSQVVRTSFTGDPRLTLPPAETFTSSALVPPEQPAAPGPRFYLNAEYLLWWTRSDHTPPLVTTSSPNDFGFVGNPTTQVLFGGNLDRNPYSGARLTAGYYLDDCGHTAIEVSGFILGQESARFMASSAQFPVIARPFFNLNQGTEFSQLVAFPGVSTGNVQINAPSRLWGAEANLRCNLCCGCDYKVDALGGFRYLNLEESIAIQENIQGLAGAPAPFTNALVTVNDHFATRNQFYGGQLGLDAEFRRGAWSLDLRGKLALGDTHQHLTIDGSETLVAPNGAVTVSRGGLLALPSNIGQFNRDKFSVVPELGVSLGYQLTERLRVTVGYNFLYWTNVLRPGNQIDRVIDVTQIPNFTVPGATPAGQNRPAVPFKESDYWAQGLTVGLEFRY